MFKMKPVVIFEKVANKKQCNKCKEFLPAILTSFGFNKLGKLGLTSICRNCRNKSNNKGIGIEPRHILFEKKTPKKCCVKCDLLLPIDSVNFKKHKTSKGIYEFDNTCRSCSRKARRKYYHNNPDIIKPIAKKQFAKTKEKKKQQRGEKEQERLKLLSQGFKQCSCCKEIIPATTEFFHLSCGELRAKCKICKNKSDKKRRIPKDRKKPSKQIILFEKLLLKKCKCCHKILPAIGNYWKGSKDGLYGVKSTCKNCDSKDGKTIFTIDEDELKYFEKLYKLKHGENCIKEKVCSKCSISFPNTEEFFVKSPKMYDGLGAFCRDCNNKRNKDHREKYPNQKKEYGKKYRANPNNKTRTRERNKNWNKKQRATNPFHRMKHYIRQAIKCAFTENGFKKNSKTHEISGCSFANFRKHIESMFEGWMNLENHGKYTGKYNETWQYDHIIPISTAVTIEDVVRLNHYTNFQPLCSKKNLEKGSKLDWVDTHPYIPKEESVF